MSDIGPTGWDKEEVYDEEIDPLVAKIIEICKREELPMLISINYRSSDDDGDGENHYCTSYTPGPGAKANKTLFEALKVIRSRRTQAAAFAITRT